MLELLRHRILPAADLGAAIERAQGLQAEALLAVAGLGFATEEGLRLVLGEKGGTAAGRLLDPTVTVPIFGSLQSGGLWLPGGVVSIVHEKLGARYPEITQKAADTAELLDTLAQYFPTVEDRAEASQLAVFQYFNHEARVAAFGPQDGAELERFARCHGPAFETTPADNLRLHENLRPLLDRYVEALGDPSRNALREKVSRLWSERSNELDAAVKSAQENLNGWRPIATSCSRSWCRRGDRSRNG
jgi:hypothetical protein